MRRFRFTVQRMMVVVLIVAIGLGGDVLRRRRQTCLAYAAQHAREAGYASLALRANTETLGRYREEAERLRGLLIAPYDDEHRRIRDERILAVDEKAIRRFSTRCNQLRDAEDHHVQLRRKYERAARYPWLPVAPDPPKPK